MEDFNSKYSGEQVEALLDQVANGEVGGGGGISAESDPIFSASPAASITEADKIQWSGKQDAIADLADIREGAAMGATALQEHQPLKTINGESVVGEGDITIAGGTGEKGDKGDKGDTGVGVQSVTQTTTSDADGGSNVVTVTLSDGTTSTFTVKNGSKGSQGEQGIQGVQGIQGEKGDAGANGTNGKDGADGEDGATFTPSVDSAGNLSWTNNKGLANPPTVNIKGPKGDAGEGGGSSGGTAEKEIVSITNGVIEALEPNKIYILENINNSEFEIQSIIAADEKYAEYSVIIAAEAFIGGQGYSPSLTLPNGLKWVNGEVPYIAEGGYYELSIVYWGGLFGGGYNAVLTLFKPAE